MSPSDPPPQSTVSALTSQADPNTQPFSRKNANAYTSFTALFALSPVDAAQKDGEWTFRSAHPAYSPGNAIRAFGGHVYAQAVLAASRTVKKGFCVHVRDSRR